MGYYPVFIELSDRRCLVIGGGPEAQRKVEGLRAASAHVTVISPKLTSVLQAMVITDLPNANAANQGDTFFPDWAEVPDPDGTPTPTRNQTYTDDQGKEVEPTRFYRGEGSWWSDLEQAVYFDCTGGGSSGHLGQIWRYTPATNELALVYESHDASVLDHPDNLFVLPWGDLMICEPAGWGRSTRPSKRVRSARLRSR